NVLGNDLGEDRFNGAYQADIVNQVTSPPIDTRGFSVVRLQYRRWLNVEDADFDTATILANDQPVWSNFATGDNGDTHHQDRQWRFHDVDLSDAIDTEPQLQLTFRISSDGGLEFGGWTIDDLCVVGLDPAAGPVCGNGTLEPNETCDDGNIDDGDACPSDCGRTSDRCATDPSACDLDASDGGCRCARGNEPAKTAGLWLVLIAIGVGLRRQKRRSAANA
ncbi:MAG: hypothetical protein AAFV29_16880, partial [Myxococcota bacterium]